MEKISISEYKSPVGVLVIGIHKDKLCLCDWRDRKARTQVDNRIKNRLNSDFSFQTSELHTRVINQLEQYFNQERQNFDLPLLLAGTEFQRSVWHGLMDIPYGQTASYGQLASMLGKDSAVRAVANANGANALSIVVPCHRIIGSKGALTGYAGGLDAKKCLLAMEQTIHS